MSNNFHALYLAIIVWFTYFQINCYDYDSDGSSDLIGSFTTSVAEMMQAASNKEVFAIL